MLFNNGTNIGINKTASLLGMLDVLGDGSKPVIYAAASTGSSVVARFVGTGSVEGLYASTAGGDYGVQGEADSGIAAEKLSKDCSEVCIGVHRSSSLKVEGKPPAMSARGFRFKG